MKPQLGLALGGGGMKGLAHVGALYVLEEYRLKPDFIAGCSIGAIIGGFYAAGYSAQALAQLLQQIDLPSFFSFRFDGMGLFDTTKFRHFLEEYLPFHQIEELPLSFAAIATDLETGEEVILDKGPLIDAILASSAVPGIFPPVNIDGRLLIDGGVVNNLPVSVLLDRNMDYTIAVRLFKKSVWKEPPLTDTREHPSFIDTSQQALLAGLIARVKAQARRRIPQAFYIIKRSLDIIIAHHEELRLSKYPPDILIEPEVADIGILEFRDERKEEILQRGIQAARHHAPELHTLAQKIVSDSSYAS